MKLGIAGMLPRAAADITAENLQAVRDMGFTGACPSLGRAPDDVSAGERGRVRALFADCGLDLPQMWGPATSLIHEDPAAQARDLSAIEAGIRLAADLGCPSLVLASGSYNPAGRFFADRRNFTPEALDRVAASLRKLVPIAADHCVSIGIEPGTATVVNTPRRMRTLLDMVDSPHVKVNLDPVNWINFYEYFDSGPFLDSMFDLLAENVSAIHAKDCAYENKLCIHISEAPPGQGGLDYHTFLRRAADLPLDTYFIIEHTPDEHIPAARDHVLKVAKECGINFAARTPILGR
ncbi:MAG: sugar phosphate isomerase/epimerase [Chloroflexota bacterium]|nr:MAG: sugar phosphate isomerase/epimerase [Chloroflexota bacterium]